MFYDFFVIYQSLFDDIRKCLSKRKFFFKERLLTTNSVCTIIPQKSEGLCQDVNNDDQCYKLYTILLPFFVWIFSSFLQGHL